MLEDFLQFKCKYCKGCNNNFCRRVYLVISSDKKLPPECLSCTKRIKITIEETTKERIRQEKERESMNRYRELRIIECEDVNTLQRSVKVALFENGVQIAPTENYENLNSIINKTVRGTTEDIKNTHHHTDKYFVYNPAQDKPKHIYNSYNEAFCDAEKIAKQYNNCKIYVLKVESEITRTPYVETRTLDNNGTETVDKSDIPF